MSAMPDSNNRMTEAEYLAFERASEIKHEFVGGEIYAMTGASEAHNLIVSSTLFALYGQLRSKPCKTYPSDMKVRTPTTGSYVYPDITVVCGSPEFDDKRRDILLNPTLVIEVLSPNTEGYDRGEKFQHYRELASLQEYVLIAQDTPYIEHFVRQEQGVWQFTEAAGLDAELELVSVGCRLHLSAAYEQIDFESSSAEESQDG